MSALIPKSRWVVLLSVREVLPTGFHSECETRFFKTEEELIAALMESGWEQGRRASSLPPEPEEWKAHRER